MAIERRRRPPRKKHHPKRKREHRQEKHTKRRKKKQRKTTTPHPIDQGGLPGPSGGGGGAGGGGGDQSSVVATPDNTGTAGGMNASSNEVPATLTGQAPSDEGPAGYFSTGPGQAEHYHPVLTFVHMVAEHTDESTTDAGSTAAIAPSSSGTENNPT
jgi:hypothetical protein